jgi:autotransporter translocation and assembly factor TamB
MFKKIALILIALIALTGGLLYYVFKTTEGLRWLTHVALERFVPAQTKSVESVAGTLLTRAVLKNITLTDLKGLPPGSTVRVQELTLTAHGLNYKNADIAVHNARLKLPVSENIVIDGTASRRVLDFSVFSPAIDVEELLSLAASQNASAKSFKGTVKDIDMRIAGTFDKPALQGKFVIDTLKRPDLILTQAPGTINMQLKNINRKKIKGDIDIAKGDVKARKTKITLNPSNIHFSGDPKNPALSIDAYSRIDTVDIDILVKGTAQSPELKLMSDPPMSMQELMITLATGRKWEGLAGLEQGQVSTELVKELAGYLLASDSGDGFFSKMGITDVKVSMEEGKTGVGFKKEITDKLDLGYEVDQKGTSNATTPGQSSGLSQTIGADYRVSNTFFATIEQQMQAAGGPQSSDPSGVDDRLMMKYKTHF